MLNILFGLVHYVGYFNVFPSSYASLSILRAFPQIVNSDQNLSGPDPEKLSSKSNYSSSP